MTFDSTDFRHCMGHFTTGITVVTTINEENVRCGMTINSFSSLSLEPPLVTFSVDKNAHNHNNFANCKKFVVNILAEAQQNISKTFAHPSSVEWNNVDYETSDDGCILIKDCIAYIQCEAENIYHGGDHTIIIGRVINFQMTSDEPPLLYFKGKYRKIGDKL